MKIQIKSRWHEKVLWEGEAELLKEAIEVAVKQRADLSGANLCGASLYGANLSKAYLPGANLPGADLSEADLSGANLYRANLSEANLSEANFCGANLCGANFCGAYLSKATFSRADLRGANLNVKIPPINSHQFISEILLRAAKKEAEKDFAARIRMETDQCWEYFIKLAKRKRVMAWAKKTLFQWEEFRGKFEKEA